MKQMHYNTLLVKMVHKNEFYFIYYRYVVYVCNRYMFFCYVLFPIFIKVKLFIIFMHDTVFSDIYYRDSR